MGNDDSKPVKKLENTEHNANADNKLAEVGLKFGRVGADHSSTKNASEILAEKNAGGSLNLQLYYH